MAKRYEELSIEDDFMFGKVMEDKELCRDVLQCLLEEPVEELEEVQTQREFRYTSKGKPIRLDVYTRDQKRIYDAEMQRLNHQTPENLELPRRSRFYQSTMDTDHLSRGKSYRELPEGKVLFLCTFDPAVVVAASGKLHGVGGLSGNLRSVISSGGTAVPLIAVAVYGHTSASTGYRTYLNIRFVIEIPAASISSCFCCGIHIRRQCLAFSIAVSRTLHRRCELAQRVNHAAAQI